MNELDTIRKAIDGADTYQHLFGACHFVDHRDQLKCLRTTFANLSKAVHPDRHNGSVEAS